MTPSELWRCSCGRVHEREALIIADWNPNLLVPPCHPSKPAAYFVLDENLTELRAQAMRGALLQRRLEGLGFIIPNDAAVFQREGNPFPLVPSKRGGS